MPKELYKFTCDRKHEFYLDMDFPQSVRKWAARLVDIRCPDCQSSLIHMHAEPFHVVQIGKGAGNGA